MSYTIAPDQPDVPDIQKNIIKRTDVVREDHMSIRELLWEHKMLLDEILENRVKANAIRDELVAIDKLIAVNDIPDAI